MACQLPVCGDLLIELLRIVTGQPFHFRSLFLFREMVHVMQRLVWIFRRDTVGRAAG